EALAESVTGPILRATGVDDDVPAVLSGMIESAERVGGAQAVAMLRVLGAVGPHPVRTSAAAAAQRLVASGLPDPGWVDGLGRPTVGASFGYVDMFGSQEALAITFTYRRKQHAVAVLIDHTLGGGVKDVFVADRPRKVRDNFTHTARRCDVDVNDYATVDAADILDRALAAPPCPEAPDQVEDVGAYLDLLRARLELMRSPAPPASRAARPIRRRVHRLKVTPARVEAADLAAGLRHHPRPVARDHPGRLRPAGRLPVGVHHRGGRVRPTRVRVLRPRSRALIGPEVASSRTLWPFGGPRRAVDHDHPRRSMPGSDRNRSSAPKPVAAEQLARLTSARAPSPDHRRIRTGRGRPRAAPRRRGGLAARRRAPALGGGGAGRRRGGDRPGRLHR
ncbi:MAG: hypothetical protein L0I24_14995, partial [Pseudonocardia sp.]|nr:hypothetical protein [Pseudonocardia sp.]